MNWCIHKRSDLCIEVKTECFEFVGKFDIVLLTCDSRKLK